MQHTLRTVLLGGLALGLGGLSPAWAQPPRTSDVPSAAPAMRGATPAEGRERGDRSAVVDAAALEAGANSFTEGQARSRLEDAGFANVQNLRKDDAGFWRGQASRSGVSTEVALDFRGRIAAGPGVANLGSVGRAPGAERTAAPGPNDAARPDGTPGNPPGTAAGRAIDRATSGGTTGAGMNARPDGTPGNPPSTATGRAVDRMQGETPRADGTPGNPPGTAVGRALDRATGSNTTGTNPNAPGTTGGTTTR